ncbi:MAG: hypothetical protein ACE5IJ_08265, partial [Thermoplasmata archaeon]
EWFPENTKYSGPAIYELGVGGPRYGNTEPVYVGETGNLRKRLSAYGEDGSHLREEIDDVLADGYALYYRYQRRRSKRTARRSEKNYLDKYDYDWNIQSNTEDENW